MNVLDGHSGAAQDFPPDYKSGFVAVVGQPNVGKSTLMNALLGEKLAIVSPRPQTTRERQLGVLTLPNAQIIFVDTPGIHRARTPLGEYMVAVATGTIPDADIVLFLVDISREPDEADERISNIVREQSGRTPCLLILNKSDLVSLPVAESRTRAYQALVPTATPILVSAVRGDNVALLLDRTVSLLPRGPRYYPPDQLTDMQLRDNAAEIVREKILILFEEEIPHSVAVQVDEFKERSDRMTYVAATIYVEKESQKGILIGRKGQALKKVGEMARPDLEALIGTRVFLALWVKVLKNWRRDEQALKRLGYYHKR